MSGYPLLIDLPTAGIAGLDDRQELISADEERALIAAIGTLELAPFRFQGWTGKRLTASFGWRYDYDDRSFAPTEPIPDFLLPLRERAGAFAGVAPEQWVQALVTRYDPGAGIGWHRDRPVFDQVLGVSLGAPAALRFRRRVGSTFRRHTLPLAPRSAYRLSGDPRRLWENSIAEMDVTRWSVTFRTMATPQDR